MSTRRAAMFAVPVFLLLFLLLIGGFFGQFRQPRIDEVDREEGRSGDNFIHISHDDIRVTVERFAGDRSSLVELDIDQLEDNMLSVEIRYILDLTGDEPYTRERVLSEAKTIMAELFKADNVGEVILAGKVSPEDSGEFSGEDIVYRIRGRREKFDAVNLHELDLKEFEEHLNEIWIHENLEKKDAS